MQHKYQYRVSNAIEVSEGIEQIFVSTQVPNRRRLAGRQWRHLLSVCAEKVASGTTCRVSERRRQLVAPPTERVSGEGGQWRHLPSERAKKAASGATYRASEWRRRPVAPPTERVEKAASGATYRVSERRRRPVAPPTERVSGEGGDDARAEQRLQAVLQRLEVLAAVGVVRHVRQHQLQQGSRSRPAAGSRSPPKSARPTAVPQRRNRPECVSLLVKRQKRGMRVLY